LVLLAWLLVGIMVVCLLSRSSMPESKLGCFLKSQAEQVSRRLLREATHKAAVSKQDREAEVGLLHNAEALASAKAAKCLAEQLGVDLDTEALDLIADLEDEQAMILADLQG
jgi:hypothetical protein